MSSVKTIGNSGQISLGKEHAGKHVLVNEIEPGVWIVKLGEFIPDNERWMYAPGVKREIDKAIQWAERNSPAASDLDALERRINGR